MGGFYAATSVDGAVHVQAGGVPLLGRVDGPAVAGDRHLPVDPGIDQRAAVLGEAPRGRAEVGVAQVHHGVVPLLPLAVDHVPAHGRQVGEPRGERVLLAAGRGVGVVADGLVV